MNRYECKHEEVTFASGTYYVMCKTCGTRWVATAPGTDDRALDYRMAGNAAAGARVRLGHEYGCCNQGVVPGPNGALYMCMTHGTPDKMMQALEEHCAKRNKTITT